MLGNRRVNTRPEWAVRRALYSRGVRYRVDYALPFDRRRKADVAMPGLGIAVFIDGCFWHGCPEHYSAPARNSEYWRTKVESNRARDSDTQQRLLSLGWTALRYWAHDDPDAIVTDVLQVLSAKSDAMGSRTYARITRPLT